MSVYFILHTYQFPNEAVKVLFATLYLGGAALNWVQPRIEDYLSNPDNKREEETKQIFYNFNNLITVIKEAFGDNNEDRVTERRLIVLRQQKSVATYTTQFRTLAYKTDWENSALKAHFYKGLNRRVKEAIVAIKNPDSLAELIKLAIRIDTRQYETYINKQALSKTGPAKRQPRGDPMELDTTETKGSRTKACYLYGKTGHLKRNYPTKEVTEVTEHWFEVIEESPEGKVREYITKSWTACYKNNCLIHLSDKEGSG